MAGAMSKGKVIVSEAGKPNEEVPSGRSSLSYNFKVKPNTKGMLQIVFAIKGSFDLLGIEDVLYENKAVLTGTTGRFRDIKIL